MLVLVSATLTSNWTYGLLGFQDETLLSLTRAPLAASADTQTRKLGEGGTSDAWLGGPEQSHHPISNHTLIESSIP